jgi:hypothetical protein
MNVLVLHKNTCRRWVVQVMISISGKVQWGEGTKKRAVHRSKAGRILEWHHQQRLRSTRFPPCSATGRSSIHPLNSPAPEEPAWAGPAQDSRALPLHV